MVGAWVLIAALGATDVHELKLDYVGDGIATGASVALWAASETVLKSSLAPAQCRWCDRAPDRTDALNALDRWGRAARWSSDQQKAADTASNVATFAVLPAAMIGADVWNAASA